jgi:NADH:ubiquinone oxidoreductase subunit 4 (subunit M)
MESAHRLAFVRMALGALQMVGAISSVGLILHSGLSGLSLTCVVITSFLTKISVLLFGSRPEKKH